MAQPLGIQLLIRAHEKTREAVCFHQHLFFLVNEYSRSERISVIKQAHELVTQLSNITLKLLTDHDEWTEPEAMQFLKILLN